MDLKTITTEATHFDDSVECPLYDQGEPEVDSKGNPVVVYVVSEHSKSARRVAQLQKQEMTKLIRRYGSWEAIPQADFDRMADQRAAACLTGWKGFENDGAPLPFSTENAIAVIRGLREHKPDTLKQIDGGIAGHAAFFKQG